MRSQIRYYYNIILFIIVSLLSFGMPAYSDIKIDNGIKILIESYSQSTDNKTGVITAKGDVRISSPGKRIIASANQAQYFPNEDLIVLIGDVEVLQDGSRHISADRVVYMISEDRVVADSMNNNKVRSKFLFEPRVNKRGKLRK